MNEYPIHTPPKDYEAFRHFLMTFGVPGVILAGLAITAFMSLPEVEAKHNSSLAKNVEPHIRSGERVSLELQPLPADQYDNFSVAVQELLTNGWNVETVSLDGLITIRARGAELHCGVLDPTPFDEGDNSFPQYPSVEAVGSSLGLSQSDRTLLIWGKDMGILNGNGGAERVDTNDLVWACPELVLTK
jgi:hypothetical protein